MSNERRHLQLGSPQKHHAVPKEQEEGMVTVMILDSQGYPGIINIQGCCPWKEY